MSLLVVALYVVISYFLDFCIVKLASVLVGLGLAIVTVVFGFVLCCICYGGLCGCLECCLRDFAAFVFIYFDSLFYILLLWVLSLFCAGLICGLRVLRFALFGVVFRSVGFTFGLSVWV